MSKRDLELKAIELTKRAVGSTNVKQLTGVIIDTIRSVYNGAIEEDALFIEQLEREIHDAVGNPMIKTFTPLMANKLRERKLPAS